MSKELDIALANACRESDLETAKELLEQGADANKFGYPLRAAINNTNIDMISLLMKNGADINYTIENASIINDPEIQYFLEENNLNPNSEIKDILVEAVKNNDTNILNFVMEHTEEFEYDEDGYDEEDIEL